MANKEAAEIVKKPDSVITRILRGAVKIITGINKAVFTVCSYTLAILLVVMVGEVFRRYIFHSPSDWGFDFSLWIFGMPALLSGGYLIATKSHVNMDILYNKFSPRVKAIIDCITTVAIFAFLWVMFTQCLKAANLAIQRNEMSITNWRVPIWPVKIWMPVAAALALVQQLAETIKNLYMAITGRSLMK